MSIADISSDNPIKQLLKPRGTIYSWELLVLKLLFLGLVCFILDKPTGSLSGQVKIEEEGFSLSTYDLRDNRVYALVNGPRGGAQIERGVWVNKDGTFKFEQLPAGEYSLRVRAPGFGTESLSGLFVEEGHINKVPKDIGLSLLNPTVNIAAESRVFTTREAPHFWINASGASKATVKVFKKDLYEIWSGTNNKKNGLYFNNDFGLSIDSSSKFVDPFGKQTPIKIFSRNLEQDATDDSHAEFKFDSNLAAGDYFAEAEVVDPFGKKSAHTITWFSVSDIGLIVKHAPEKTVVRAIDLNTLKPISGVNVKLCQQLDPAHPDMQGVTAGSEGLISFNFNNAQQGSMAGDRVVIGQLGTSRAYQGQQMYLNGLNAFKTYFYTDRPIYRLGQTVYFRGISRQASQDGLKNSGAGQPITLEIEDPDNNPFKTIEVKTNKHGAFHGSIDIPEDGKTGGYQVQIKHQNGDTDYNSFEIAEYRKPEYLVEVKSLADHFVAGEKARFKVKASYFFGGPVANARVKYNCYSSVDWANRWRLSARPAYYDFFDRWDDSSSYEGTGDYTNEGYCVTDANGEATVEVPTTVPQLPEDSPLAQEFDDKKLKLEAEVTDISRLSVSGSGSATVVPGDYFLTATPDNYVIKSGDSVGLDVAAIAYDGKPVPGANVEIKMTRRPYDRIKSEYKKTILVSKMDTATNAAGKVHVDVAVGGQQPSDSYELLVTSKDKEGHVIAEDTSVWVSNESTPFSLSLRDTKATPLTVKFNKKVYQPGDTARLIITGPFNANSGMDALVSMEGRRLYDMKVVPLKSSAQLVEIPIKPEYAPNFYVNVSMVGDKRQFYNQEETVLVSPNSHFMNVSVAADKDRYKPGDTVNYTITAKDTKGKPVKDMEFSLGVVDESIYSIRAETAPNMQNFFYDRVTNWVTTVCSFPEQYSGGPDKMEPRVRKDFRDTAAWVPELSTDDKGEAHAAIKLPDNLTTWRATVRGINTACEIGSAINKVLVTQDVIARLALPRFFSTGDEGLVTAVVHNYSGKQQKIKVALSIRPFSGTGKPSLTLGQLPGTSLDLAPDAAGRLSFPVSAGAPGKVKIKLVATCPTGGDALEKELYIKPMGIPVTLVQSGCLIKDDDQTSMLLKIPATIDPFTPIKRVLAVATSTIGPVLGNFSALIKYPYGCTEQTMSRLVPSVVAMQLNKKLGVPLLQSDIKMFGEVYKEAMDKLESYQHADGGWGWWPADQTNPYLTALVLEGFKNLGDAGYKVKPEVINNGLNWQNDALNRLTVQLSDPKHAWDEWMDRERTTDLAYMLYAQSLYPQLPAPPKPKAAAVSKAPQATKAAGKAAAAVKPVKLPEVVTPAQAEDKAANYLLGKRDSLPPQALSYLTRALKLRGKDSQARTCLDRLIFLANTSERTFDWDNTKALQQKIGVDHYAYYSYRFTPEETTALAVQTIVEVSDYDSDLHQSKKQDIIEKAKAWILMQRGKDGWGSTKTTAQVFKALLADELNVNRSRDGNGINKTLELISVNFTGRLLKELGLSTGNYTADTTFALPAAGNLDLSKTGAGRLYYSVTSDYYQDLSGDKANVSIPNMPTDLKIERQFCHLVSQASTSDGVIHVKAVPITDGKVKAGETILMKVRVTAPHAMPYVMLQADLPSGAEVVRSENEAASVDRDTSTADYISGDWGMPWWSHQDILDDKIVFFGTDLRTGKSEFTTLLRMELPGKVKVNPVMLEGMYTKSIKAFSFPLVDKLEVVE